MRREVEGGGGGDMRREVEGGGGGGDMGEESLEVPKLRFMTQKQNHV